MFRGKNGSARPLVELETTALSNSASRLRRLEVETVSAFEEWEEQDPQGPGSAGPGSAADR